jgi:Raf kinase inhibitor-like YbhB/YbcL family protein
MSEMTLVSSAFTEGGAIPRRHTCEGDDLSPALSWSNVPANARTLALVVDDPDAPDPAAPRTTWVHWVVCNLPAATTGLPEGVPVSALPEGTRVGTNDFHGVGWGGPCPPVGRHRYFFKLYALDIALPEVAAVNKAAVEKAMRGHVIAEARVMGTYQKGP